MLKISTTYAILEDVTEKIEKVSQTLGKIISETILTFGAFLSGQLLVSIVLGTLYSLGLYFIGTKYPIFIGYLSGLLNLIPYGGFFIGLGIAVGVTLLDLFSWWQPVAVIVLYLIGQICESFFLTPKIVGQRIGIRPLFIFLAILIGAQLAGFPGLIFAVPVLIVINVIRKRIG